MTKKILISVFCLFLALHLAAQSLLGGTFSYVICDLETGEILDQQNSDLPVTPASTTKLITTATALEMLGGDYRFSTFIEHDGTVENGVLNGNLYIRGTGDPTLGSSIFPENYFLQTWLLAIKNAGISQINGRIVADASAYDKVGYHLNWDVEDVGKCYGTGCYALSVYDNLQIHTFRSDSAGTQVEWLKSEPQIDDFVLENRLKATNDKKSFTYFQGLPLSDFRAICGQIPCNQKAYEVCGDIPNPPLFLAQELHKTLVENGISVEFHPATEFEKSEKNENRTIIYTHFSPELREIVKITNFRSNNHFAEHIFKHLAWKKSGFGTSECAAQLIRDFWESKGLDVRQFFQVDGSGLARMNAFTTDFLTKILIFMYTQSTQKDDFVASLPLVGKEGTVHNLLRNSKLQGKIRAKSGSINRVHCYAGYVFWNGKTYAFSVAANNFYQPRANVKKAIEKWLESNFLVEN